MTPIIPQTYDREILDAHAQFGGDLWMMQFVYDLQTALEPFADAAECIDPTFADHLHMWEHSASMQVTAVHFRRAKELLGKRRIHPKPALQPQEALNV